MKRHLLFAICILVPTIVLLVPAHLFPIDSFSVIEHRLVAIFMLAMLFWIFEPIPIYATSIVIIVLQLLLISDKAFILFNKAHSALPFGTVLSYRDVMATFASPIIMLFLGGFFLAAAATKYKLDVNLARVLLKPFGVKPKNIMFGLMLATAIFSMFMSNTATTAMMLALLAPILRLFEKEDRGRIGFVLAIPFAANIGGIGTPIGTPPNAIALKYLVGDNVISFGQWMSFAFPFVVILLFFAWLLIWKLYPTAMPEMNLHIKDEFRKDWKAKTVYVTFALTIFLWLFDFLHGMNAYIVAMIPIAVFSALQILTAQDMRNLSWDVLWLIAGGIALGQAMEKTGLAQHAIESINFAGMSSVLIVMVAVLITFSLANMMSHTATANLMLPIIAALGVNVSSLAMLGGDKMMILAATFAASLAMTLPISTPPNAMAHSTGTFETKHMALPGIIIGSVGLLLIVVLMYMLKLVHFI